MLREVLGEREKERRLEVTPPVACAKGDGAGESGGGDGDDDGGDGTGYSINDLIDDLVAEDVDDAGGSYNRGGGVAA